MTRRESLTLWANVLLSALLISLAPVLFGWTLLKIAAWYVERIPERKLPLTEYWQGWNPRFYKWLSDFLSYWADGLKLTTALLFLFALIIWQVFGGYVASAVLLLESVVAVIFLYKSSFRMAKYFCWDINIWQAEPAARILVGNPEEYNSMSEDDKYKVRRHIAEVHIGINKGSWLVSGGKAKLLNPPAGFLSRFGGAGILVVQEGHAVVTERSGKISRVKGYGTHYLEPFETVSQVIYLGMQRGAFDFEHVITKDRIVIDKMQVNVFYKVDPGRRSDRSGMYSFDRVVIVEKIWSAKSIDSEGRSASVEGSVRAVANTVVRDTVAQYDLEDLITATGTIRAELRTKLRDAIQAVTQNVMGIVTPVVDVGEITFPANARDKLMDRWKIDRQAQIDQITADTEKRTKIIEAQARQEAEASEATIARIRAETKKYETITDAQARQEALAAEAAIARAKLEIKRQETIIDAEARQEALTAETAIARAKLELKRQETITDAEARQEALTAEAAIARANLELKRQETIIAAEARRVAEESEAAIARMRAETKKQETLTDAEARQEALTAETAIARAKLELKRQETITDAEARKVAEESEVIIARMRAEIEKNKVLSEAQGKREAVIATSDAKYQEIVAEAEAKRQARIKAGEAEQEYQALAGKGKAAAKHEEGMAEAEVEAERMRQAAAAVSNLDPETARLVMQVYGNTQSRRIMARLTRSLENAGAVDKELINTANTDKHAE